MSCQECQYSKFVYDEKEKYYMTKCFRGENECPKEYLFKLIEKHLHIFKD